MRIGMMGARAWLRHVGALALSTSFCAFGCGNTLGTPPVDADDDENSGASALPPEQDPSEILGRPVVFREGLELHDVEFDGTQFIAVGESGTFRAIEDESIQLGARSLVLRSADGLSWTRVFESASGPILDVVFAHGRWVAVGDANWPITIAETAYDPVVVTSEDGENWGLGPVPTEIGLHRVIAGQSDFTAISRRSVWRSTTGATWTELGAPSTEGESSLSLSGIVRSKGITIAYSSQELFRSLDEGVTWEKAPPIGDFDSNIAFWAVADGFAGDTQMAGREHYDVSSVDGLSWTRVERDGQGVYQVVNSPSATVRRTDKYQAAVDVLATDGSWVATLEACNALVYGAGLFIAASPGGISSSVDGATWEPGAISLD